MSLLPKNRIRPKVCNPDGKRLLRRVRLNEDFWTIRQSLERTFEKGVASRGFNGVWPANDTPIRNRLAIVPNWHSGGTNKEAPDWTSTCYRVIESSNSNHQQSERLASHSSTRNDMQRVWASLFLLTLGLSSGKNTIVTKILTSTFQLWVLDNIFVLHVNELWWVQNHVGEFPKFQINR